MKNQPGRQIRQELHGIEEGTGKSLPELMMVIAILGVLTAMAGPSYKTMTTRAQANSAAAELASELRMARQLAMARRERLLVRFDLPAQTVTIRRAETGAVLDVYRYAEKGITVEEPTAGPELFFHPSGRSASATSIVILDRNRRRSIITVSLTGRVVLA